ncbi:MAG: winged helix-turn-helix transcriptional regulator [Bdellovibrionota bacterium]|nr:MAG: winged helix-turn-helix transcriptional regulator [Bdellovibrionota bacterium]
MTDVALDAVDKRILYELDLNSRQPVSDLARKLGLNRDRIVYRIKQMQKQGVIRGFSTIINPTKLGLFVFKTYLRLERDEKRIQVLVRHLRDHPKVHWLAECDGAWDIMFSIYAANPYEFHNLQQQVLHQFGDIIAVVKSYAVIDAWCFRRGYLMGVSSDPVLFGGEPAAHQLDSLDRAILRILSTDSRSTKKEIADQLKVSSMLVKYRIDRLEDLGIISGYSLDIDLDLLGISFFKAQLHLDAYDRSSAELLLEYCRSHPDITYLIRQIGDCALEIEVEASGYQHFSQIVADVRQRFSSIIREVDTVLIRSHQFKWAPYSDDRIDIPSTNAEGRSRGKKGATQHGIAAAGKEGRG